MWQIICVCLPAITEGEQQRMYALLNDAVHDSCHRNLNAVDVGLSFLHFLKPEEALTVLQERRDLIRRSQGLVDSRELEQIKDVQGIIQDHILTLLSAELEWLDRTIAHLASVQHAAD